MFLSIFSFSQPLASFCSPWPHHLASTLYFFKPVRRPCHVTTAMCIHHPPFISLLPSLRFSVTEVFTGPFCPQLLSWSLTSSSFQTTFTFFFHQQFQFGGKRMVTTTNRPSNSLVSFPYPQIPLPCWVAAVLLLCWEPLQSRTVIYSLEFQCYCSHNTKSIFLSNVYMLQTIEEVIERNTGKSLKNTFNSSFEE